MTSPADQSANIAAARREIAEILGYSQVPDAMKVRELGLFATFEMSLISALDRYPDEFVLRLVSELRGGSDAFLLAITKMMFVGLRGWFKVTPLDARGLKRLETIVRFASACEHSPHPEVLQAAHTVKGWTRAMSHTDEAAIVAVVAAAFAYAAEQEDSRRHIPKEDSPIVQYSVDHSRDHTRVAAIVRQRGCDTELINLMLGVTPSLLQGAL